MGVPGSTVVGIEGDGDPIYLSIPKSQASGVRVEGAGGKDDYWAPIDDAYARVSIQDTQGSNWITNIGRNVRGQVSVADNDVAALQHDKGGLDLVPAGQSGPNPALTATGSFLDAFKSWLAGLFS